MHNGNPGERRLDVSKEKLPITAVQALTPIAFLVTLLGCSVYLFGADSSYGANQIALLLATCVAALVSRSRGVSWREAS